MMWNLRTRLDRLERATNGHDEFHAVPWYTEADHIVHAGRRLTWEEFAERYPRAPKPLRWAEE